MGMLDTIRQFRKDVKERSIQHEIEKDEQIRRDMDVLKEHQKRLDTRMEHEKLKQEVHEQERSLSWVNRFKQKVGSDVVKAASGKPTKAMRNTAIHIGGTAVNPERAAPAQKEEVDERSSWDVGKAKKHDWGL